jgi:hypothetical protein
MSLNKDYPQITPITPNRKQEDISRDVAFQR